MAFGGLRTFFGSGNNSIPAAPACTGSQAVSVGDLIVAVLAQQTALTVTQCGDNLHGANSYTAVNAGTLNGTTISLRMFYRRVTVAGTLTTVTFAATSSTNDAAWAAAIFEGPFDPVAVLDKAPANTTDSTTPYASAATGVLSQPDEMVVAAHAQASAATNTATSPMVKQLQQAQSANANVSLFSKVVSATTDTTPGWTGTSATAVQIVATFRKAFPLTPSLFTNTNDLTFNHTIGLFLTPSVFTNNQSFFTPTMAQPGVDQNLTPSLYTNNQSFFTPTVLATYNLSPTLYGNSQGYFQQTVTPGAVNLAPSLHTNSQSFPAPTVASTYPLTPGLFTNSISFFTPLVEQPGGLQNLSPSLLPSENSFELGSPDFFFTPLLEQPAGLDQTVRPNLFGNTNTFFAATVTPGAIDLVVTALYTNTQSFFDPTVGRGAVDLQPALFTNTNNFFTPTVTTLTSLSPSLFTNSQNFFNPTVLSTYALTPSLVPSTNAFFTPAVNQVIFPSLFTNANSFNTHTISAGTANIAPNLFTNANFFFQPQVIQPGGGTAFITNPMIASVGAMMIR